MLKTLTAPTGSPIQGTLELMRGIQSLDPSNDDG